MNRVIKFRGKRVDNGEWVYGFVVVNKDGTIYIKDTDYNVNNGRIDIIPCQVDPSTVGQFTGLLDKDGKEIYEGDVIIAANGANHTILYGKWRYPSHIDTDDLVDHGIGFNIGGIEPFGECVIGGGSLYQIIGNIHDNPELTK